MAMATTYRVRELSYAYIVEWGGEDRGREVAVVVIEDAAQRLYRCCRCRRHGCSHAKAVLHHVIDREGA